jgi:hypothetical protein
MATTKQAANISAASTETRAPKAGLLRRIAARYGIDQDKMLETLKATAFRQRGKDNKPPPEITGEQMVALLTVAERYGLDPFVKQIYAFPNQAGGIEPIVPIDGWLKLINEHPQMLSLALTYGPAEAGEPPSWIECAIKRKDRPDPIVIREYMAECYRDTGPWKSHPARMLRHKAIIQCGRVAFALTGIYDPDEAERIHDANTIEGEPAGKPETREPRRLSDKSPVEKVTPAQVTMLTERMVSAKADVRALCEHFEIAALVEMPADQVNAAVDWINANGA